MEARTWTYRRLRTVTREKAEHLRLLFHDIPLVRRSVVSVETLVLQVINATERLERMTYPTRYERLDKDDLG